MKTYILVASLLCANISQASPASPLRHIVASFGSDYFFVMHESEDGRTSKGVCFKIDGSDKPTIEWKTEGFYAWPEQLLLSYDGEYLLKKNDILMDDLKSESTLYQVYRRGKLLHSLNVGSLFKIQNIKPDPYRPQYANFAPSDSEKSWCLLKGADLQDILRREGLVSEISAKDWYAQIITDDKAVYFNLETGKFLKLASLPNLNGK